MSELASSQTALETFFARHKPTWFGDFHVQQFNQFLKHGLPTRKEELWKYTEIKVHDIPTHSGVAKTGLQIEHNKPFAVTLVFVNGHFSETLSTTTALPKEVTLCSLSQAMVSQPDRIKSILLQEFSVKKFPFAKLNSALMTDGFFLDIPKHCVITTPIHIQFINTEQNEFMSHPRNVILASPHSQVTLIEDHLSENATRYFTNVVTHIHSAENAHVNYYKMQEDDLTALHIANIFIEQLQDSCVNTFSLAKGARLAREDISVWQRAKGAETHLHGLYLLHADNQHMDNHLHVDHLSEHGTSSMLYKGILDKKSRAVFNGKVYVHSKTKQIHAHQANHNLLLSPDAEVNTKPELEIYAEDVKCTHGATIGQLDDAALFYLLSRGIAKNEAHQLLLYAFADEIYSKITDASLKEYFRNRMSRHD